LGVVLSVVWFIWFGFWLWTVAVDDANRSFEFHYSLCNSLLEMANQELRIAQTQEERYEVSVAGSAAYKNCEVEAMTSFRKQVDANYKGIPLLLGVDLASVVLGWLIVPPVVGVARLIAKGFAS
jgi:hypothetical protein